MLVDVGSEQIFISPQHFLGITDLFDLFLALAWNARIDRVVSLHFLGGVENFFIPAERADNMLACFVVSRLSWTFWSPKTR